MPRRSAPPTHARVDEASYQQQIVEFGQMLGWQFNHVFPCPRSDRRANFTPTTVKGWFDLYGWNETQRRAIHIEVKGDDGVLSPAQRAHGQSLRRAGIEAYVWWPDDFPQAQLILRRKPRP